jgi:hypothetical protein
MWVPAGPAVKEGYAKGSSAPVHRSKSMFLAYHLRAQQLIFDLSPSGSIVSRRFIRDSSAKGIRWSTVRHPLYSM